MNPARAVATRGTCWRPPGTARAESREARHQITLKVKQQVPYTITGSVRASGPASTSAPTIEFLKCEIGLHARRRQPAEPDGLGGALREESSIHPSEELIINCAAVRGSSSTAVGAGTDEADLAWSYTITLGQ